MNPTLFVDANPLKGRLPQYLNAIGHSGKLHPSGTRLTARCPLHQDNKPSFTAQLKDAGWVWFCHPCGLGGTVMELHAHRTGRNPKEDFRTILEEVADLVNLAPSTPPLPIEKPAAGVVAWKASQAIGFDDLERITTLWRCRLYEDDALRVAFASHLKLSPQTLRRLTMPSLDAFGIAPAGHRLIKSDGTSFRLQMPRLVYIGEGGYKVRDPFGNGKVRFWCVGHLHRPWRSHWLMRTAPIITDVHLVESESSAAALIEAGFEAPFHQGTCVVATSGCNGFSPNWLRFFRGRRIHFWPDRDCSGRRFFEKTAALLHGTSCGVLEHHFHLQSHE